MSVQSELTLEKLKIRDDLTSLIIEVRFANATLLELKEKVKTQNGRIGKLENWRSYTLGAMAVTLFVISLVVKHQ